MTKSLFKTNSALGLRTLFLVIIAFSCIILEQHSTAFQRLRAKISTLVLPIQIAVDAPTRFVHWINLNLETKRQLQEENTRLRAQSLLLQAQLQKLLILEQENQQLRQLLQSAGRSSEKMTVAQLLAVDLDPSLHQMVLDKGLRDKAYVGQPVMDGHGVVGQIIEVGPITSRVLLLTDSRFAIPVQDSKNGVRGIAIGLGTNQLVVINVIDTAAVKVGDTWVASSLGLRFPEGYPVGIVSAIQHDASQQLPVIYLTPAAHIDQLRQVLLAWPHNEELYSHVHQQIIKKTTS